MRTCTIPDFWYCINQELKNAILEDIIQLGKEAGLKSFEQVI